MTQGISDRMLLDMMLTAGIEHIVTVPCSITASWHRRAVQSANSGGLSVHRTTHEGNLPGIAAGLWFGTGVPALIHMQNSGLTNAGDGLISFASRRVYGVPLIALVTWRGYDDADDSEPHQAIGVLTPTLMEALFGPDHVSWSQRPDDGFLDALEDANRGGPAAFVVRRDTLSSEAVDRVRYVVPTRPEGRAVVRSTVRIQTSDGPPPTLRGFVGGTSRDDALRAIVDVHRDAAIVFSNGYTSRAAQQVVDRPGNLYLAGYMGGALAVGYGLAIARPDLEVVVVDGDQNAAMSTMKDHLAAEHPPNLTWYVLDNGVGASVGGAQSLPVAPAIREMAHVIRTRPDEPGAFPHPRLSTRGAYAYCLPEQPAGSLQGLTRGFRDWVATARFT